MKKAFSTFVPLLRKVEKGELVIENVALDRDGHIKLSD